MKDATIVEGAAYSKKSDLVLLQYRGSSPNRELRTLSRRYYIRYSYYVSLRMALLNLTRTHRHSPSARYAGPGGTLLSLALLYGPDFTSSYRKTREL